MTEYVKTLCRESDNTFDCLSREWLIEISPQLKASSVAKYTNILNLYLLPRFGSMLIEDITRNDIIVMSRELLSCGGNRANGLAPNTIKSILSLIKILFEYASNEKGVQTADVKKITIKQSQKPMRVLSRSEHHRLSVYLCNNITPCNLGILLSLYTGLRIGEICALKWGDISLEEQYIYVHNSMQRIQVKNDPYKKTEVIIQAPKSDCSIRNIPVPDEILKMLKANKKDDSAYLLTGKSYKFVEPRSLSNHFRTVARECNISNVNYHALRHTFATRCVELGFDIKSLSEILGHAGVNFTMNRYVHPSMELKQKNMNMLSDLLSE